MKNKITAKEKIIQAFKDLLKVYPIEKISVTDIVRVSNINRSTFYDNYPTIIELIDEVVKEETTKILGVPKDFANKPAKEVIIEVLKKIKDNARNYKIVNKSHYSLVPFDYIKESTPPHTSNNDILFFKAGTDEILKKWLESGCKQDIDELASYIVTIMHKIFQFNN